MMVKLIASAAMVLTALALSACISSPPHPEMPNTNLANTSRVATQEAQASREAADAQAEADAVVTESAGATAQAEATAAQEALQATGTASAAGTHVAMASATAQAEPMAGRVAELITSGHLDSAAGEYLRLPDFNESWAQIDWYIFYPTGLTPTDFVLRADAFWRSASETANWWNSGCGFVFRENGVENHYLAYLGLDGSVYMQRNVDGNPASLGSSYYGPLETPAGEAEIMLLVEESWFTVFVNGVEVRHRQDQALETGGLAFTLVSGTNKDFGTRCKLENVDLWVLENE